MFYNYKLTVDIQKVNNEYHVATLDRTYDFGGTSKDFEVIGGDGVDIFTVVTDILTMYDYRGVNILFLLDQKELDKLQAIRQTALSTETKLEYYIKSFNGTVTFIPNWSVVGYKVYGDTSKLENEDKVAFVNGKNEELGLELGYPYGNGVFQIVNGGPEVGKIALIKVAREFEDGSYGQTTVAECLIKGHKPTLDYSRQIDVARLSFENYLHAHNEKELLEAISR